MTKRPMCRNELCSFLYTEGNGSSMDSLAAGLSVYDYCVDSGGGRDNEFMQSIQERFDTLLEELHLEFVNSKQREPYSLIDGMAASLEVYVERHCPEVPGDFEHNRISYAQAVAEAANPELNAQIETCDARYALYDTVREKIKELQVERDGIGQAIKALKTHVLHDVSGTEPIPF